MNLVISFLVALGLCSVLLIDYFVIRAISFFDELKELEIQEDEEIIEEEISYEEININTLKQLAKERGIKGYSTMKKAELIEALSKEDE